MLSESERKGTAIGLVRIDDQNYVLKSISPESDDEDFARFKREREVYRQRLAAWTQPELVDSAETWLLLTSVDGVSLRESMVRSPRPETVLQAVEAVATKSAQYRRRSQPTDPTSDFVAAARSRFRNLLTSGPAGTETSPTNARLCRGIARRSDRCVERIATRWVRRCDEVGAKIVSPIQHNDLHGNNVLVSGSETFVIDYESSTSPGCWPIDVLYFAATTFAAADRDLRTSIREASVAAVIAVEPDLGSTYPALQDLFNAAAALNRRFAIGTHPVHAFSPFVRSLYSLARVPA